MSKQGKLMMAGLTVLLLLGSAVHAADPAPAGQAGSPSAVSAPAGPSNSLLRLQVTEGAAGPQVEMVADGDLAYTSEVLSNPDRLVLDLPGTVSRLVAPQVTVGAGGVQRVRAGQYRTKPAPVTRVVFDLDGPVTHHIEKKETGLLVSFGAAPAPAAPGPPARFRRPPPDHCPSSRSGAPPARPGRRPPG